MDYPNHILSNGPTSVRNDSAGKLKRIAKVLLVLGVPFTLCWAYGLGMEVESPSSSIAPDFNHLYGMEGGVETWLHGGVLGKNFLQDDNDDVYQYLDGVSSVTVPTTRENDLQSDMAAFGYTNFEYKVPMSKDAHFPIASNTKLYTAVAIYQLYEEGKLDVDADIADMLDKDDFVKFGLEPTWWPGRKKLCPRVAPQSMLPWITSCEKITLRNLLSMSSGIYPALNCNAPALAPNLCNRDPYFVSRGSIARTVGTFITKPLMFKPGTSYHYSNPNFILAAYFVEKYSAMTFRAYLQQNIFDRLGLKDTYFDFFNGSMKLDPRRVGQYARFYDKDSRELMAVGTDVLQLDLGVASGTGGVISTVRDHAIFWHTLFDKEAKGAPLLSKASSQQAILSPWTLVQHGPLHLPDGTTMDAWIYYTQGTVIVCDHENCDDADHNTSANRATNKSVRYVFYTGGTLTVHTANVLDYQSMKMAQVWTSTLVAMASPSAYQSFFDEQIGSIFAVGGSWFDPNFGNPMTLAFEKLFENEPISVHRLEKSS